VDTIAWARLAFHVQGWPVKKIVRELYVPRISIRNISRSHVADFSYERERQPMPRIGHWQGQLKQFLSPNANKTSPERLTLIRILEELRVPGYEDAYVAARRFAKPGQISAALLRPRPICRRHKPMGMPVSSTGVMGLC
jgi:hypothetical protein